MGGVDNLGDNFARSGGSGGLVGQVGVGENGVQVFDGGVEGRGIGIARVGQGVGHDLRDAAGLGGQHHDPRGQKHGFGDVVGHEHQRAQRVAGCGEQAADFVAQRLGGEHVECAEGLVHTEHLGLGNQGAGDAHALFHAAGEFARVRAFVGP